MTDAAWRDPSAVVGGWADLAPPSRRDLVGRERGGFWAAVADLGVRLLVTREYEHLLLSLAVVDGRPDVTYLPLPHPSGVAVADDGVVWVASTRNPNALVELAPEGDVLLPRRTRFLPGRLYLHDLALVGGALHATAVGEDSVGTIGVDDGYQRRWWPGSVEPGENRLQLNSIAAGADLASSRFTASAAAPGERRPGDPAFPVDGTGVVFDGASREPVLTGLTRPHSARWHRDAVVVADSGQGRVVRGTTGTADVVVSLGSWTRGIAVVGDVAFVGTSRVLPRFESYAPGIEADRSECGLHAVHLGTGDVLGSLRWPEGDQVFAVEVLPVPSPGLPARPGRTMAREVRDLYYSFGG